MPMIPSTSVDQVLEHVISHIKAHVSSISNNAIKPPFILGLTGLQGSGKSTWTDALVSTLRDKHNYHTINISLDDLYLDHDRLVKLRERQPPNKLLQTRGQPGTHDTDLSLQFFKSLMNPLKDILLPSFDKSLFNGEGGRVPCEKWKRIPASEAVDIVIFEGWCVGFQPLEEDQLRSQWHQAAEMESKSHYSTHTLKDHSIQNLLEVNGHLRQYCQSFMGPQHFNYLIHLDTDDLVNVYEWRLQQEHAMWKAKNEGMSDESVVKFVKGYMPAYELYLNQLRKGFFADGGEKGQLRVVLDKERRITRMSSTY
ncbi:hypothetical protein N7478_005871 [Penicillium angulare]|uniref:uncharacterized protein n=1 Tax=Penicillium angulare TaxID=116970 RepID=UPI002541B572|nr:uncharacterized protein N7478_005871 [Penicillium angulare]KAJ5280499.1 hypothetical protein N7478_005871 [Penicillium angulare]